MTAARRGGKIVGYRRVSSIDQNESRQLEGVQVDKLFTDKVSGKNLNRPQLQAALEYLRDGDVLVVHSLDRLARNLDDLRKIVTTLTDNGVQVQFVKEGLLYTGDDNAMSKLLLSVMGSFAEFERSLIRERQREGIAIAKVEGRYKGRKPSLSAEQVREAKDKAAAGVPMAKLARDLDVSRQTLYTAFAESRV